MGIASYSCTAIRTSEHYALCAGLREAFHSAGNCRTGCEAEFSLGDIE